jgi:hypothetical protein
MPQLPEPPAMRLALSSGPVRIPVLPSNRSAIDAAGSSHVALNQHGVRRCAWPIGIVARGPLPRAAVSPPLSFDVDDCGAQRGEMLEVAGARFPSQATLNSQFVTCLAVDGSRSDSLLVARNRHATTAPSAAGLMIKMPRSLRINTDTFVGDAIRRRTRGDGPPDEELLKKENRCAVIRAQETHVQNLRLHLRNLASASEKGNSKV